MRGRDVSQSVTVTGSDGRKARPKTMTDEKSRRAHDAQSKPDVNADVDSPGYRERVFEIVRRIPVGRVMTYGQLADILGEGDRKSVV